MSFHDLPLRIQHERLIQLRAVVVLLVMGDTSLIDRMIGDIDPPTVDPMPPAAELVDAIETWLGGAA